MKERVSWSGTQNILFSFPMLKRERKELCDGTESEESVPI